MTRKPAFIVLSHQLMSMVGPLATALKHRGIATYVLASKPTREMKTDWQADVDLLHITKNHALQTSDIDLFLTQLSAANVQLLGCITVWDAYRELMAYTNHQIDVVDLPPATVRQLRDKLTMRTCLREHGLSNVAAWPLDEERYDALEDRTRYFIKPREGLASLGAFRADQLGDFGELDTLWRKARQDLAYAGAFTGDPSFVLEEFIDGVECSFEVSVAQGSATVHAVHEKVDLRDGGRTILENACICPPSSLGSSEVEHGIDYIELCLKALGVDTGLYHIEARYLNERGWEIVEINPRIGGAYIVASTRLHCGVDLLEQWIDLLLGRRGVLPAAAERSTFFRVFFGEPGRQISRLARQPGRIEVLEEKLFVREGEELPHVDREIFIGQALWDITGLSPCLLEDFFLETETYLRIEYQS